MPSIKKTALIILIIILAVWFLLGQIQIKITGKIIIPGAVNNQFYKVTVTINPEKVVIECHNKIFRLFNAFDSPHFKRITLNAKEIMEIRIDKLGNLEIFPDDSLYQRYRNLYHTIREYMGFFCGSFYEKERPGLIIALENVEQFKSDSSSVFSIINKQKNQSKSGSDRIFTREHGAKIYTY
jgi:hypothetical protein